MLIYNTTAPRRRPQMGRFFLHDYPRLVRQTWPFHLASLLIGLLFCLLAMERVVDDPLLVSDILGGADHEFVGERTAADIRDRFREPPMPVLFAHVTTNNIMVSFNAFALGVTFGLGTLFVLALNGAMLGGYTGAFAASDLADVFWITVLPHGALELSAVVIAGGAGLLIGYTMWCPGRRSFRRAMIEEGRRAVLLVVGLIPAFIIAGLFEGFLTPSDAISDAVKVTIGVAAAVLFWLYILFGGRRDIGGRQPSG